MNPERSWRSHDEADAARIFGLDEARLIVTELAETYQGMADDPCLSERIRERRRGQATALRLAADGICDYAHPDRD